MATLIFIDTNIWLDFYRVRGRQAELSFLERIEENCDRLITGSQVEMEYKKNRPHVILESYRGLKSPDMSSLQLPAYLARSKQSKGLETGKKKIKDQITTLRERTQRVFAEPTTHDPVYKVAQRIFKNPGPYNLSRIRKERDSIRRLAYKRFVLGYPPRKSGDTSVGDAINWEWIVRCAIDSGEDIVIVSRDSDFGIAFEGHPHLNDWLLQEFKERVSKKRSIRLTDRLSEAFKLASVDVTKDEEAAEEEFLKDRSTRGWTYLQPAEGGGNISLLPWSDVSTEGRTRVYSQLFTVAPADLSAIWGHSTTGGLFDSEPTKTSAPEDEEP